MAENSVGTANQRGPGRPFQQGKSGNPGGRPKLAGHVREIARQHTERAIQVLVRSLESTDERVRIAAANAILDRGFGKPGREEENTEDSRLLEFVRLIENPSSDRASILHAVRRLEVQGR